MPRIRKYDERGVTNDYNMVLWSFLYEICTSKCRVLKASYDAWYAKLQTTEIFRLFVAFYFLFWPVAACETDKSHKADHIWNDLGDDITFFMGQVVDLLLLLLLLLLLYLCCWMRSERMKLGVEYIFHHDNMTEARWLDIIRSRVIAWTSAQLEN